MMGGLVDPAFDAVLEGWLPVNLLSSTVPINNCFAADLLVADSACPKSLET